MINDHKTQESVSPKEDIKNGISSYECSSSNDHISCQHSFRMNSMPYHVEQQKQIEQITEDISSPENIEPDDDTLLSSYVNEHISCKQNFRINSMPYHPKVDKIHQQKQSNQITE